MLILKGAPLQVLEICYRYLASIGGPEKARGRTSEQHDQAVQAKGDAAVRGGALGQALQQGPELGDRLLLADADRLEHPLLH